MDNACAVAGAKTKYERTVRTIDYRTPDGNTLVQIAVDQQGAILGVENISVSHVAGRDSSGRTARVVQVVVRSLSRPPPECGFGMTRFERLSQCLRVSVVK